MATLTNGEIEATYVKKEELENYQTISDANSTYVKKTDINLAKFNELKAKYEELKNRLDRIDQGEITSASIDTAIKK